MAGTTNDKLNLLRQIKEAFRTAITGQGQTISDNDPFSAWPAKVEAIQSGGMELTYDNITITTRKSLNGTLESGYLLRVPLPEEIANPKFLMVSIGGSHFNSMTEYLSANRVGEFGGGGVMDNRDGSNPTFLFTGTLNYAYVESDGTFRRGSEEGDDLLFYNSEQNCFEFEICRSAYTDGILAAIADLHYWYF